MPITGQGARRDNSSAPGSPKAETMIALGQGENSAAAINLAAVPSASGVAIRVGPSGAVQPLGAAVRARAAMAHIASVVAALLLGFIRITGVMQSH